MGKIRRRREHVWERSLKGNPKNTPQGKAEDICLRCRLMNKTEVNQCSERRGYIHTQRQREER